MDVMNNALIDLVSRFVLGLTSTPPSLEVHLFVNQWNMANNTTIANLVECDAPGYAPVPLTPGNWMGSTTGGVSTYTYPTVSFNFTGPGVPPQIVYGHWIGDSASGDVLWGLTWPAPYVIPAAGSTIYLAPTWTNQSCPPPCCPC